MSSSTTKAGRWLPRWRPAAATTWTSEAGRLSFGDTVRDPIVLRLVMIAGIDSFGTGLYIATSVLFFTTVRHFQAATVATALSLGSICALIISPSIGKLADRRSVKPTLTVLMLLRGAGYGALSLAANSVSLIAVICLLTVVDRACYPLNQSLLGGAVGEERRPMALGVMYSVRNVGVVLGSLLAVVPVSLHSGVLYGAAIEINAASFVFAALALKRIPVAASKPVLLSGPASAKPSRNAKLVGLTGLHAVLFSHTTILSVILPLWVVNRTSAPAWVVPILLGLNAILAAALQIPISARLTNAPAAARTTAASGAALLLACLFYASASAFDAQTAVALLIGGMVLHTVAECAHESGCWQLAFIISPPTSRNSYLSFFNAGKTLQDIVGPAAFVYLLVRGAVHNWILIGLGIALVGLLALRYSGALSSDSAVRAASPA